MLRKDQLINPMELLTALDNPLRTLQHPIRTL